MLTGVGALVDFEVLAAGEHFAASGEGTREGLLAGVHADVVDEFVLGLEGAAVAAAALPETGVVGALGSAHVLHRDVGNNFMHGIEQLVARLLGIRLVHVDPQTR